MYSMTNYRFTDPFSHKKLKFMSMDSYYQKKNLGSGSRSNNKDRGVKITEIRHFCFFMYNHLHIVSTGNLVSGRDIFAGYSAKSVSGTTIVPGPDPLPYIYRMTSYHK